jgi:integrase
MPKITADLITKTPAPAKGSNLLWDTGHADAIKGFAFRVFAASKLHPTGARSFLISYRVNGVEKRHTIGAFPTWTVTAARAEAKELRQRIDRGEDPAEMKREAREAPKVRDLIDRYIRDHLPKKATGARGERTKDEHRMLAEIAAILGEHRRVVDIHFGDIQHLHESITKSGRPIRANRVLAAASTMFSLALKPLPGEAKPWRNQAQGNPCKGVSRNPEHGRERFFSSAELAALSDVLASYNGGISSVADCIKFCMLTGCRPGEAMKSTWDEFDSEPAFWIKPSAHMKARRTHKLPLNPAALELIERLRKKRGKSPYVFPSSVPSKPLQDLSHCWEWCCRRAGIENARIYDLRHSFAAIGASGGLSLPIIGKLLGHTQPRTTQRYAHLADDPLREATDKIGAAIANAGNSGADVLPIKGRRS